MKKLFAIILSIAMLLSLSSSALALNYPEHSGNAATFETLAEARANGPAAIQHLEDNPKKTLVSHPVLDGYPEGSTFVYRSANRYGGRAAGRMNTTLLVFAEQHFDEKDAALDYLKSLGVIDIIDKAIGSVVLVTPANGETFGAADQKSYYALQTAMLSLKQGGTDAAGNAVTYSDAEYYGGFAYWYLIGIDGGATFLNNYVATAYDYISRVAGMLLIGGDMARVNEIAEYVPVYLVNAGEDVVDKYIAINGAEAYSRQKPVETWYNQTWPLRRVMSATVEGEVDVKYYIQQAYDKLFTEAMRIPVGPIGVHSAGTPYQGYSLDQAPYALCDRNAVVDGWTKDGIQVTMYQDDRFNYVQANGEYLQTWVEYLPEEVVNGTAPEGSVPLILASHGGSDDPRQYVDEIGLLELAGKERIAIVAPEEQYISGILRDILPDFTRYILDKYPALDRSRVYITGYSMGGFATLNGIYGDSSLFAAAVPQAGAGVISPTAEDEVQYETIDLPFMICHSEYDMFFYIDNATGNITNLVQTDISRFLKFNEMEPVEFDFETYPASGFEGDIYEEKMLGGEHLNRCWYLLNDEGVPMVALNYTNDLQHALYPEYAQVIWDYCKQFSRDPETLEIIYNPYVD